MAVSPLPVGLTEARSDGSIVCRLCAHLCRLRPGQSGRCFIRHHLNGELRLSAYGRPALLALEPIEKKYLFHFLPGSQTLSLGTAGCNLSCSYCINWRVSQTGESGKEEIVSPEAVVARAVAAGASAVAFTYTEPTVFFEYARDIAALARRAGLAVVAKSNGYMTPEALRAMTGWLDGVNIDLKGWDGPEYGRIVGGSLAITLDNLRLARELGVWLEVSSLLVPGLNTDEGALRGMAGFIANELGVETPWHLLRFFPHYLLQEKRPTSQGELETAVRIGREAGLRFIYNRELYRGEQWQTVCPHCRATVIAREGFERAQNWAGTAGRCPACEREVVGVYDLAAVRLGRKTGVDL